MRRAIVLTLALFAATSAWAGTPKSPVSRTAIAEMEKSIDERFTNILPENPYGVLGLTRGVYLEGYGAVFSLEMNLVPGVSITPFYPRMTPEKVKATHQTKLERLKQLHQTMRDVLMDTAARLTVVPEGEQIVLVVNLFSHAWENTKGVPGQLVMQARRQVLLDLKAGRGDRAKLEAAVQVREF
jgi:hypothetical protein